MTAKKTTAKKLTDNDIISSYMDYVLEHGKEPVTIYAFCKEVKFTEANFYQFFGSFENLKEQIWSVMHDNTLSLLEKDKNYEEYPNKERMLAYFFTMFEILTANRSYALFALQEYEMPLKNLKQLKSLRIKVKQFAEELIEIGNESKNSRFTKNPIKLFSEGAWIQFLFLLKYWIDDTSAGFEKTDVAIEKSVKAVFDVFETTPLDSLLDFGKFLFKEHFDFAKA